MPKGKYFTPEQIAAMKYPIPEDGKCLCGCGHMTEIAPRSRSKYNWIKGKPKPFYRSHRPKPFVNKGGRRVASGPKYIEDPVTGCWNWLGSLDGCGYGSLSRDGAQHRAHVYYYEREHGKVPDGLELDHKCHNRKCIRPSHLEPVTHLENVRRGDATKLTREQVVDIILSYGKMSHHDVAKKYAISSTYIHAIWRRQVWQDVLPELPLRKGMTRNGEESGHAKITEQQVREIRMRREQGEMPLALATEYGISVAQVRRIIKRTKWKHVV